MNEPEFAKDLEWVHFCRGTILKPYPRLICSSCRQGDGTFERSLPKKVVEEIQRHQAFIHKLGFELEDLYGRAEAKDCDHQGSHNL